MRLSSVRTLLLSGVAAAAIAGAAWAQTPPTPQPTPGGDARAHRFERMCADAPARGAARLAYMEVKLGITDAQKPAWTTFTQEAKAAAEPMRKLCQNPPKRDPQADAATILGERERFSGAVYETTKGMRAAIEKLQATLTPEQKTKLAEMVRRSMGGHRHGMHRGGHGGPGMGPTPAGGQPPR